MRPIQLCLELLAVLAVANASVMDALRQVPNGWSFVGSPAPSQTMHFRIAMTQVCRIQRLWFYMLPGTESPSPGSACSSN